MSGLRRVMQFLSQRSRAYQLCFGSPAGKAVLSDLAVFCRARETCIVTERDHHVDRDRTLILEGRREVWLRIQQHTKLSDDELYRLFVSPEQTDG